MHVHKIVYIKTFKIETCWSDFKCFNINNFMYVH